MTSRRFSMSLPLAFLLLAGCDTAQQKLALKQDLAALKAETEKLKEEVAELKKEANEARLKALFETRTLAYLTPGDEGYSVIESDLGSLTVKLANVQPYANGSRVSLTFGNLTSATINGASATLDGGTVDGEGSPDNQGQKTREITFSESLARGAWTGVSVVLEGVPPDKLGFVRVRKIRHTAIQLNR